LKHEVGGRKPSSYVRTGPLPGVQRDGRYVVVGHHLATGQVKQNSCTFMLLAVQKHKHKNIAIKLQAGIAVRTVMFTVHGAQI
jgi:hypothetical protein